ncbi:MAG TPA: PmoA family protein [Ohtaekwangia sp.]|nr:PmoA family protein [Ohtaekwangia sp.]
MKISLVMAFLFAGVIANAQKRHEGFRFLDHIDKKQIDVLYNDTLLTAYCYFDSIMKPVLFPIRTVSGITVTRGYPIAPRAGERIDHPHHIGLWLNYESVNGLDFWNHSTAIPAARRQKYGTIIHDGIVRTDVNPKSSTLEVTARWVDHGGMILLRESTTYKFSIADSNTFVIDRTTILNALDMDVDFRDVKDGLLGIRVARELEHPSNEPDVFLDDKGNATAVAVIDNEGVTGQYLSSEGRQGDDVWGTRGRWVTLQGIIRQKPVSITIIDHPSNPGYPTYWHARGYGLFAANPLGQEVFSKGKEKLNLKINKGESVTFHYRIVIAEGKPLGPDGIAALEKSFVSTARQ